MSGQACVTTEDFQSNGRYLFRQPKALQWFEDGRLIKRQEGERQAGRFELFLDLLYVAILSNFADDLSKNISGLQIVKYILILSLSWNVWSDLRELMNSFYNDDLLQRTLILWVMAVLVVYGNNAVLVDKSIGAIRSTVAAYIIARVSCTLAHLFNSFASYHHRQQLRLWVGLSFVALCIYIPLFFQSVSIRGKIATAAVGISVENFFWVFCFSTAAKKFLRVKYSTAVDIAHEIDRLAAFYIIALGEFLYLIVVNSPAAIGLNDRLLRTVWTLVIAFCLNWIYLHADGGMQCTHPIRHSVATGFGWTMLHLPLIACVLAGGHVAAVSTTEEFEDPQRWLLCGSLGTAMILLYIMALMHSSKDEPGLLILSKHWRMLVRPITGTIIICLGLAHDLNATAVLSIIMSLIVFCLIWETVTSLRKCAKVWETWVDLYPDDASRTKEESKNEDRTVSCLTPV